MMLLRGFYILLIHGLTVAVATPASPGQCAPSEPLQFVTVTSAGGCPLTLYYPGNQASKEAYLAPVFCVTGDAKLLLATASFEFDALLSKAYLNVPVIVSNSELLAEARETLKSLLQGRTLDFLQPVSIQEEGGQELTVPMLTHPDSVTAFVRWQCGYRDCADILTGLGKGGTWSTAKLLDLKVTLGIPGSQPITLTYKIVTANQSRELSPLTSPSVRTAPECTNLKLHQVLTVDDFCTVTVLKRTDTENDFAIEPMLCYYGNYTATPNGRTLTLQLDVKSARVRGIVSTSLGPLSPTTVTFMSVVGAELRASRSLSKWKFENLRLRTDGDRLELRVGCGDDRDCTQFIAHLTSNSLSLWRHLSITVESQLDGHSAACVRRNQKTVSHAQERGVAFKYMPDYDAIDGLLCVKSQYIRQQPLDFEFNEICAIWCSKLRTCQAFRVDVGRCLLFVFDRCSKDTHEPRCDRRGQVFVKKPQGLQPGRLCPDGSAGAFGA